MIQACAMHVLAIQSLFIRTCVTKHISSLQVWSRVTVIVFNATRQHCPSHYSHCIKITTSCIIFAESGNVHYNSYHCIKASHSCMQYHNINFFSTCPRAQRVASEAPTDTVETAPSMSKINQMASKTHVRTHYNIIAAIQTQYQ